MFEAQEKCLKDDILSLLCSMEKRITDKDLRKAYREAHGENINNPLEKLYGPKYTLYQFLRYKCSEFCSIYRLDNEVKIDRLSNEITEKFEEAAKSKKRHVTKNSAPKLNFPKSHHLAKSQHFNPQGFTKTSHVVVTDPIYDAERNNLPNKIEYVELEAEYQPPRINYKVPLVSFLHNLTDTDVESMSMQVNELSAFAEDFVPKRAPRVQNPFEFPNLPNSNTKSEAQSELEAESNDKNPPSKDMSSFSELVKKSIEKKPRVEKMKPITSKPEHSSDRPLKIQEKTPDQKPMVQKSIARPKKNEAESENCRMDSSLKVQQNTPKTNHTTVKTASVPVPESSTSVVRNIATVTPPVPIPAPQQPVKSYVSLQADSYIFMMDFPDIVRLPDVKFLMPNIKILETKMLFPILVTATHSPSQFYIQYDDSILSAMMKEMMEFYTKVPDYLLKININNIYTGMVCAVKIEGVWHRAKVVNIVDNKQTEVFFVDFGTKLIIDNCSIKYLLKRFMSAPVKAVRASLFGVLPDVGEVWSMGTRHLFYLKVKDKTLNATIRSYDQINDCFLVEIYENGQTQKSLAEELLENFCAFLPPINPPTFPFAVLLPFH